MYIHLFDVFGNKCSCNVLVWCFRVWTRWRDPTDGPEARGSQEQVMCQANTAGAEPVQRHGLRIKEKERIKIIRSHFHFKFLLDTLNSESCFCKAFSTWEASHLLFLHKKDWRHNTHTPMMLDKHKTSICTSTEDITATSQPFVTILRWAWKTHQSMPPFVTRSKTSELWAIRGISVQGQNQKTSCTTALFFWKKQHPLKTWVKFIHVIQAETCPDPRLT